MRVLPCSPRPGLRVAARRASCAPRSRRRGPHGKTFSRRRQGCGGGAVFGRWSSRNRLGFRLAKPLSLCNEVLHITICIVVETPPLDSGDQSGTPSGQPGPSKPSVGSRRGRSHASESPSPRRRSRSRHNSDRPTQTGIPPRNSLTFNSPSTEILRGSRTRSESPRRESSGRPRQRLRVSFVPNTCSPQANASRRNSSSAVISWIRGRNLPPIGSSHEGHGGGWRSCASPLPSLARAGA